MIIRWFALGWVISGILAIDVAAAAQDVPVAPADEEALPEPRNLDLSFSVRPQRIPSRKALQVYVKHRPMSGDSTVAIAAIAHSPALEEFRKPVLQALMDSLQEHPFVQHVRSVAPTEEGKQLTHAEVVQRSAAVRPKAVMIMDLEPAGDRLNPVITLSLYSEKGEAWGTLDATGAIIVHSAEQYRRMVRQRMPAPTGATAQWRLSRQPVPVDFLVEKLGERSSICVASVTTAAEPQISTASKQLVAAVTSSLKKHAKVSSARELPGISAETTRADVHRAAYAAGCTATVHLRLRPPEDDVVDVELLAMDANGKVVAFGRTQQLVMQLHGAAGETEWSEFKKSAVHPVAVIIVSTSFFDRRGAIAKSTSDSRADHVGLANADGELIPDAELDTLNAPAELAARVSTVAASARRVEMLRWGVYLPLLLLPLTVIPGMIVGAVAGALLGALVTGWGAVVSGTGTAPTAEHIAASAFPNSGILSGVGFILGGMLGALPPALAHLALQGYRYFLIYEAPRLTNQQVVSLGAAHNLALARRLGIDPAEAGQEFFPFPEDFAPAPAPTR